MDHSPSKRRLRKHKPRLREAATDELSSDTKELLSLERAQIEPSPAALERERVALALKLAQRHSLVRNAVHDGRKRR